MEQRPLRLGDILDDYCPRERRVTNHAVVAMIEDTVKQTRCTTCDAEHPYKGGQAPRRRKKGTPEPVATLAENETNLPPALATADTPDDNLNHSDNGLGEAPVLVPGEVPLEDEPTLVQAAPRASAAEEPPVDAQPDEAEAEPILEDDSEDPISEVEEGPVHRRLIRATLPRPEGQKDERRPTDFTIRQNAGRGNVAGPPAFRGSNSPRMKTRGGGGGGGGVHGGNGHRPGGAPRFGGARPGPGQSRGQGGGFRSAQQQPRQGGGRKRSR